MFKYCDSLYISILYFDINIHLYFCTEEKLNLIKLPFEK